MSENDGKKTLGLRGGARPGNVKQSFSHGRTKNVVVETKRKRVVVPKPGTGKTGSGSAAPGDPSKRPAGISDAEMDRRLKAVQAAKAREAEEAAAREAEEKARAEERERRRAEQEAKERQEREREESLKAKAEEDARRKEEAEAAAKAAAAPVEEPVVARPTNTKAPEAAPRKQQDRDRDNNKRGGKGGDDNRRSGKLTLNQALAGGEGGRQRSMAAMKRKQERARQKAMGGPVEREKVVRDVQVPEAIVVSELANRMSEKVGEVVKALMNNGMMVTQNQTIDADTAELIVEEFGHKVVRVSDADVEDVIKEVEDDEKDLKSRPPVITIMGHVDHGKTSLLDAMRSTDVVSGEAGGITQHIGAYQVQLKSGDKISFLDTPGHAAFSAMRARGANVTDIVILVVAANDSVMPQTIEAIRHAQAAEVPIIVAVNKVDLPEADASRVLTDLLQHDIQVEAMGGEVQAIEVSALKKTGLDALTEAITLQAELLELKANPKRDADGIVVESQLDKGRGPVATVLVKRGSLKRGDIVVAGAQWGKVRALVNERGQQMKEAGPSIPAEILGLDGTPEPGDAFNVVDSEARAREITEYRQRMKRQKQGVATQRASLEQFMTSLKDGSADTKDLPIVLKGDVQGSVEAITQSLEKLSTDEVRANVVFGAAGGISESDILLAQSSGAPVFAFNVRANKQARDLAEKEGVEIRYYSIIYELIDEVKASLSGMLEPEKKETFIGYADILEVFNITKVGKVAGCKVTEGVVKRGCGVRLLRDDVVIHEGMLKTLKRFKDEVPEVTNGMECGMAFEKYEDIREGDKIECFEVEMIARSLD